MHPGVKLYMLNILPHPLWVVQNLQSETNFVVDKEIKNEKLKIDRFCNLEFGKCVCITIYYYNWIRKSSKSTWTDFVCFPFAISLCTRCTSSSVLLILTILLLQEKNKRLYMDRMVVMCGWLCVNYSRILKILVHRILVTGWNQFGSIHLTQLSYSCRHLKNAIAFPKILHSYDHLDLKYLITLHMAVKYLLVLTIKFIRKWAVNKYYYS